MQLFQQRNKLRAFLIAPLFLCVIALFTIGPPLLDDTDYSLSEMFTNFSAQTLETVLADHRSSGAATSASGVLATLAKHAFDLVDRLVAGPMKLRTLFATTFSPQDADGAAASAAKLIESFRRHGAPPDSDFAAIVDPGWELSTPRLAALLRDAGWTLLLRPPLGGPAESARAASLARLHLWNLTEYGRVVFLESDCLVVGRVDGLLSLDLDAHPLWAAPAARRDVPPGAMDAGVLVLRPNATAFARLVAAAAAGGDEQDGGGAGASGDSAGRILAGEFGGRVGDLGLRNNADIAVYAEDRARWDQAAADGGISVVHYTAQRPWQCGEEFADVCRLWVEAPAPAARCEVTLVTSYFALNSKHSPGEYRAWMRSVLSLDACMVIVTSPANASLFLERDPLRTRVIAVELAALAPRFNRSIAFWEAQFKLDSEKGYHKGYKLYWVWGLKPLLVADAISSNTFESEYFFWIDVGCLRDDKYSGRTLRSVPPQVRNSTSVFFSNVANFSRHELTLSPDGTSVVNWMPDRLAGAVWGGRASAVLAFRDAYFRTFNRMADAGHFVGKDQTLMNIACVENAPDLCAMIWPSWSVYNIWFYMVPFLLGDTPADVPHAVTSD